MAETEEIPMSEIQRQSSIRESTSGIDNEEKCDFLTDIPEDTCDGEHKSPILYELPPGKKYHLFIAHSASRR